LKLLIKADKNKTGIITKDAFIQACEKSGANLTKEELKRVLDYFNHGSSHIDFVKMAKDLNLAGER